MYETQFLDLLIPTEAETRPHKLVFSQKDMGNRKKTPLWQMFADSFELLEGNQSYCNYEFGKKFLKIKNVNQFLIV